MTIAGNDQRNLTGSFAGLRVLDFSTTIAGPHCTRMLADMGAEVIKIETEEGETMRTRPPVRNNCSTAFGQLNVGKKSLVLDLKSEDGKETVRRCGLMWGVEAGSMRRHEITEALIADAAARVIELGWCKRGQRVGITAGLPSGRPGTTSLFQVQQL